MKKIEIIFFVIILVSISLMFILHFYVNQPYIFKNQCESLGGSYDELENVDCSIMHPVCFMVCNMNGKTYNYYDGNLCVLDCKDFNDEQKAKGSEKRCVC
jgi:hypothetical protein